MAEAGADIGGCCGPCVYSALASWCILHPFGTDTSCCGGPRGCCGSCCDSSFNEDDLDERMKKEQAKDGADAESVNAQPAPLQDMAMATEDSKPTANEVV